MLPRRSLHTSTLGLPLFALLAGCAYDAELGTDDSLADTDRVESSLSPSKLGAAAKPGKVAPSPGTDGPSLPPTSDDCSGLTGSLSASTTSIQKGESVTLSWSASTRGRCSGLYVALNDEVVAASGSRTVQPQTNTGFSLVAREPRVGETMIRSVTVNVALPPRTTITADNQQALLIQALGTPGQRITVQPHVQMRLPISTIRIAEGVVITGGRTPQTPGALLYSTPVRTLFQVTGDNVRISGLRIQGPDLGVVTSGEVRFGIQADSPVDLEIDNNELFGWSGSAIGVSDRQGRIDHFGVPTVRVHDNFIHHNQYADKFGYGVVVGDGAYVRIERNVFDYNRHAIAGDGSDDSGYQAYENLVLSHGGLHLWGPFWTQTHQFDMHGQDNCGVSGLFSDASFNCGTAGHDMYIRRNSFLYTAGPAIKLRGTPQLGPYGMFVGDNVFAHEHQRDAIEQTQSGLLVEHGNRFELDGTRALRSCDLDGDGLLDHFLATGQTWWYSSQGTMAWSYLNTSTKLSSEVELRDATGDGRCDVIAGGVIYPSGKPASPLVSPVRPVLSAD